MFKLVSIEAENFFSFKNFSLGFSRGLTLITGYDEGCKDSNGSGKSTILNAIAWAFFGKTLKGVLGKDVVRWGNTDCLVILTLTDKDHIYEIKRSLMELRFSIDNVAAKGHKNDLQMLINTTFKTDYYLFIRSTAFSQNQVEFIGAAGDSEKKKFFKDILGLSRLDRAYERVRLLYDSTYRDCESAEYKIIPLEGQIKILEGKCLELGKQKEEWEGNIVARIGSLLSRKEKKPEDTDSLERKVAECEKKLSEYGDLENSRRRIEAELSTLTIEQGGNDKEIERQWTLIRNSGDIVKNSRCEVCGGIINRKMLSYHRKELEGKIENLNKMNADVVSKKNNLQRILSNISRDEVYKEKAKVSLEDTKRAVAKNILEWEQYTKYCEDIDEQIEELKRGENPYSQQITDYEEAIKVEKYNLQELTKGFEKAKKDLDIYTFLKYVLSREGAISHIVEKEFGRLVTLSNHFLSGISGGNLYISIQPQRELKSGSLKEEITIDIYLKNQKATYWGISDGQRARINIALLLALNKLCQEHGVNNFDFILLDEVLDLSLDEGGEQDVTFLLKMYLRECSTILLVSHKSQFKASFTNMIRVYRDSNGISHLVE